MRILKGKAKYLVVVIVLLLLAAAVPVSFDAEAKSTRCVTVKKAFSRCCQALTDKKVQRDLLAATGIESSDSSEAASASSSNTNWTASVMNINPFTGSYSHSEDFRVRCQSDVGPVELDLRQDTKVTLSELQVDTYSLQADKKVKLYRHSMRLVPDENSTIANIELEMKVRLTFPWLFHSAASSRMAQVVDSQIESFADRLQQSMGDSSLP